MCAKLRQHLRMLNKERRVGRICLEIVQALQAELDELLREALRFVVVLLLYALRDFPLQRVAVIQGMERREECRTPPLALLEFGEGVSPIQTTFQQRYH